MSLNSARATKSGILYLGGSRHGRNLLAVPDGLENSHQISTHDSGNFFI